MLTLASASFASSALPITILIHRLGMLTYNGHWLLIVFANISFCPLTWNSGLLTDLILYVAKTNSNISASAPQTTNKINEVTEFTTKFQIYCHLIRKVTIYRLKN